MRLSGPEQTKTLTLSDGTVAVIRRPRGRDLARAQMIVPDPEVKKIEYTAAMLAQVTTLNGDPCVMEDILELWAGDINLLSKEAASDDGFLPLTESSSHSLLNGDSRTPSS